MNLHDFALQFLLALTVLDGGVQSSALPDDQCLHAVQLPTDLTCQAVADLCKASVDHLWRINDFPDQASMCAQPLRSKTKVCCEAIEPGFYIPCPEICLMNYDPVCGSDGRTYPNKCLCELSACHNPRANITCQKKGSCRVPQCLSPACLGLLICDQPFGPICGTNGFTYINQCFFNNELCCSQGLSFAHRGICGFRVGLSLEDTCAQIPCSGLERPVCGSDGVTYSSQCELDRESCRNQSKKLDVISDGPCRPGLVSECIDKCPKIIAPVCGTDNVTYENSCFLELNACRFPDLGIALKGIGSCEPVNKNLGLELMLGGLVGDIGEDVSAREGAALIHHAARAVVRKHCYDFWGRNCIFPFVFKGRTHIRCTRDIFGHPWCATKVDSRRNIVRRGRCETGCDV